MTNYTRGVFWGEIDRLAELPSLPIAAWKDVCKYRNVPVTEPDCDFERGYADGWRGDKTYRDVCEVAASVEPEIV